MMTAPEAPYRTIPEGLELRLRVTPKAAKPGLGGRKAEATGGARLALRVREPADRGRANRAVIELLADRLGLPKSALRLVAGESDRNKTLVVSGDPAHLLARLETWLAESETKEPGEA